jgi:hypothetical protein
LIDGLAVAPDEATVFEDTQTNDQSIEQKIQDKGLTAPRITPADIEANIAGEFSFTVGNAARALQCPVSEAVDLLTICVLTLKNGFTVTGESACASPENFDAELGHEIARKNAIDKVWPLMGYALKERLAVRERKDATMEQYMEQARKLAAQCWCDEETSGKEMDAALAEAVARRIAVWMDTAAQMARNADFYRRLLNECA